MFFCWDADDVGKLVHRPVRKRWSKKKLDENQNINAWKKDYHDLQNTEWLFQLDSEFFDPKQKEADNNSGGYDSNVVPTKIRHFVEREWHQE